MLLTSDKNHFFNKILLDITILRYNIYIYYSTIVNESYGNPVDFQNEIWNMLKAQV